MHKDKWEQTISHEENIEFILYNRALGNVVANNEIIYKFWSINKRYQEKSWSTIQKWWYHFIHQHFLTFRRNTHVAHKLPKNYLDKIQEFYSYSIKLRNKNYFEMWAISKMDEIPIYLNMPTSTTVKTIG